MGKWSLRDVPNTIDWSPTAHFFTSKLASYNPVLVSIIMASGAVQGFLGGYLRGVIWGKYLHNL